MYSIIKFIENIFKFIKIKIKILYWKIKYGKRLKIGKKFRFRKGMIINIAKEGYLEIGNNCSFNNYCSINCRNRIIIKDNNMFGENVKIYDHNHVFNNKNVNMQKTYKCRKIYIGNNNWIGTNVLILSKTSIGDYNVISGNTKLNSMFDNENIVENQKIEKINYIKRGEKNG